MTLATPLRMGRRLVRHANVAQALREMALLLEMENVSFKPQAHEKAARVIAFTP